MDTHIKASGDRRDGAQSVNMGAMTGEILMVLHKHKIRLRGDVAMTIVTMSISEGLIRQLDPDFDVVRRAIPYFIQFRSWKSAALRCVSITAHTRGFSGAAFCGRIPGRVLPVCTAVAGVLGRDGTGGRRGRREEGDAQCAGARWQGRGAVGAGAAVWRGVGAREPREVRGAGAGACLRSRFRS